MVYTIRESKAEAASSIGSILDTLVSSCTKVSKVKTRAKTERPKNATTRTKSAKKASRSRSVTQPTKKRKRSRTCGSNDYLPHVSKGKGGCFSEAEDHVLLEAFKNTEKTTSGRYAGKTNWQAIARHVHGRTSVQCKNRYLNHLTNGVAKKGPWTVDEDRILLEAYNNTDKHARGTTCAGQTNWVAISKCLDGRSATQCRDRYNRNRKLAPQNNKSVKSAVNTPLEAKKWTRQSQTTTPQISGDQNSTATFETPLGVRSRRTIWPKVEDRIVPETNANADEKVSCVDEVA